MLRAVLQENGDRSGVAANHLMKSSPWGNSSSHKSCGNNEITLLDRGHIPCVCL